MMFKSPIAKRRWANFKANKRAYYSLWIFAVLFFISLVAELVANDRPLLVRYQGQLISPIFTNYTEDYFGSDFQTAAQYRDIEVRCLIRTGGLQACLDDPEAVYEQAQTGIVDGASIQYGWMIWPLIPYSFDTINQISNVPSPPDRDHWLGTDDQTRDVLARAIYGFRISVIFGLCVVFFSTIIGIFAGAVMGYFGGWVDLLFQRFVEIWDGIPMLYLIIIMSTLFTINLPTLMILVILFSWMGLVNLVRAEFLRARNFEYIRAARALGVGDFTIMFRHVLPNAMIATLTFMPFFITGAIGALTTLDFLGYGLPPSYPSLGELSLQARNNLQAPWLAFAAFVTLASMLSLLVFIFEGVRDAFDPRKTFV